MSTTTNGFERQELGNIEDSVSLFSSFAVPNNAVVLDVGTNVGSFPAALSTAGWKNVTGIDIAADRIEYGKTLYPQLADRLLPYDGLTFPVDSGSIDVVTMFNLIEHIRPEQMQPFLAETYRVMKTGAKLVIMTPNKPIDMVYETIRHRDFGWRVWHCSLQTVRSMKTLLEGAGFSDVQYFKTNLQTAYYRGRARQYLGPLAKPVVGLLERMPLALYPTISAMAIKTS